MEELRSDDGGNGVAASPSHSQDEIDTNQLLCDVRNPMLNPIVMSRVFEVCSLSDLPRFRLVSKEWYSLSLARFRKEMWAVISPDGLQWESLSEVLDVEEGEPHFRNFRITNVEFGHPLRIEPVTRKHRNVMMAQFWKKYGGWIRKLHLDSIKIYEMEDFLRAIFEETPNLEELHLGIISNLHSQRAIDDEDGFVIVGEEHDALRNVQPNLKLLSVNGSESMTISSISWERVFSHFPNIEKLVVIPFHGDAKMVVKKETRFTAISQALQRKAKEHAKFTVTDLCLVLKYPAFVQVGTRIIQTQRLILPRLNLEFKMNAGEDEEVQLLSTAFLLHGQTLESVSIRTITRSSPYPNFPFQPGPFPSLAKLELDGNCCRNLHFLEHFPNLEYLRMLNANANLLRETDSAIMEKICLIQLTEFYLHLNDWNDTRYITEEAMLMLVKVMPAVKKFSADLSNSSLRVVCREWNLLMCLWIGSFSHRCPIDDRGLTGLGTSDEQLANITDLKELKLLVIHKGEGIGDTSIWNGFLKLPKLVQLTVHLDYETNDEAFETLRKKFPESGGSWIFRNPRV